jgi:hypothetical protein
MKMFGYKRDEVDGQFRIFCNKLPDLYTLPRIVRVVKSVRLQWASHVPWFETGSAADITLVRKPLG